MPAAPTRDDTWLINVTLFPPEGQPISLGTFDTFEGGAVTSEESRYRPGGMGAEISLGGVKSIENVTVGRYLDLLRDWPLLKTISSLVGVARGSIGRTPLQPNGARGGEPIVWNGTLQTMTPPDVDSTSNDAALVELEFVVDGDLG